MKTDTTEKGLETLIVRHMTGVDGLSSGASGIVAETAPNTAAAAGSPVTPRRMTASSPWMWSSSSPFLVATQPEETAKLGIGDYNDKKAIARQKFLARLQGEISRRGTIDVLRHGIKHGN